MRGLKKWTLEIKAAKKGNNEPEEPKNNVLLVLVSLVLWKNPTQSFTFFFIY